MGTLLPEDVVRRIKGLNHMLRDFEAEAADFIETIAQTDYGVHPGTLLQRSGYNAQPLKDFLGTDKGNCARVKRVINKDNLDLSLVRMGFTDIHKFGLGLCQAFESDFLKAIAEEAAGVEDACVYVDKLKCSVRVTAFDAEVTIWVSYVVA